MLIPNSQPTPQMPKDDLHVSHPSSNPYHFNLCLLFANMAMLYVLIDLHESEFSLKADYLGHV